MRLLEFIINWLTVPLQIWVLGLLIKKNLLLRFRAFFAYTAYVAFITIVRSPLIERPVYLKVYWWTEALSVVLSLLALYESFWVIFGRFRRLLWFRLLWPGTMVTICVLSAWRAWVHPPAHFTRGGAILISAVILSSYTVMGLVFLFFLLIKLVPTRWYLCEFHIVYGFGLASLGMAASMVVRSEFGTRFAWLTVWGPPIIYTAAVIIWLSALLRTKPQIALDGARRWRTRQAL